MMGMSPWHTMSIWTKYHGTLLQFKNYWVKNTNLVHVNASLTSFGSWTNRNGEWGDHVTLQAAADKVLILPLPTVLLMA
jgi:hypothetical protein